MRIIHLTKETKNNLLQDLLKRSPNNYGQYESIVADIIEQVKTRKDDAVHFLSLPPQNPEDGYGADWHPSPLTHRKTAELVVEKVKSIMNW